MILLILVFLPDLFAKEEPKEPKNKKAKKKKKDDEEKSSLSALSQGNEEEADSFNE